MNPNVLCRCPSLVALTPKQSTRPSVHVYSTYLDFGRERPRLLPFPVFLLSSILVPLNTEIEENAQIMFCRIRIYLFHLVRQKWQVFRKESLFVAKGEIFQS